MEFQISTEIAAPADIVWAVMSDVERWPEWTASVSHVRRWQRQRPFAVGSRALVLQPKLPPAVWTVTSLTDGREFIWRAGLPGWWTIGGHRVEPLGPSSARATLSLVFKGWLAARLAGRMRELVESYVGMELRGLKARSESRARERYGLCG